MKISEKLYEYHRFTNPQSYGKYKRETKIVQREILKLKQSNIIERVCRENRKGLQAKPKN